MPKTAWWRVGDEVDDLSGANRRFATKSPDLRVGPRWSILFAEAPICFKSVRQGVEKIPVFITRVPFFCIRKPPPLSVRTPFPRKEGALSDRAVRGIYIPDSNCIGEDRRFYRITPARMICPGLDDTGRVGAGQCFFSKTPPLGEGEGHSS